MEGRHDMPFGAQVQDDGSVRFSVWAPASDSIQVEIAGGGAFAMDAAGEGWHVLETRAAGHGSRYRLRLANGTTVPDAASRFQPEGATGMSEVIDPRTYDWSQSHWSGRPWEEAVFYELNVAAFDRDGDYDAVRRRLDHLKDLGVTALELMPVADGPGTRSWGYDAVMLFAPRRSYGRPEALKRLIDAAHERELMIFLDVVYNHFGPEGNFLPQYAPPFLTDRHQTPWGAAINFDGPDSGPVRRFFIDNALYWLEEYRFDGLRLDAVHAIIDDSETHILDELADAVRNGPGSERRVHLVLENDANEAHFLEREAEGSVGRYCAQWNDDAHHVTHVLVTGETAGYYGDYADDPAGYLLRCLEQGFAWQGEPSPYRDGRPRGEPSARLPPTAFVNFIQNHDQVGNRAVGDRITELAPAEAVRAATALLLLAPFPPLLFMGQEWGTRQPFPFFCDCDEPLATAVREGRRREFPEIVADRVPDPCSVDTFAAGVLDWSWSESSESREWLALHQDLLRLRRDVILPLLRDLRAEPDACARLDDAGVTAAWTDGNVRLTLLSNLGPTPVAAVRPAGACFYATANLPKAVTKEQRKEGERLDLAPWSVAWFRS